MPNSLVQISNTMNKYDDFKSLIQRKPTAQSNHPWLQISCFIKVADVAVSQVGTLISSFSEDSVPKSSDFHWGANRGV